MTAYCLHPGVVNTELVRFKNEFSFPIRTLLNLCYYGGLRYFVKSASSGAQTSVYCAVEPGIEHLSGKYFRYCRV